MQRFFKTMGVSLVLGVALCGAAHAQTFSAASVEYAREAQTLQASGEHKKAVKQLKKGLKVEGLSPYETSTMYQMMGASYYKRGKIDDTIEAFQNAIQAGGLSRKNKVDLQANVAQLNIAEKNYALGAQQLETYFREGGVQKSKLVKLLVQAHMRSDNKAAAVPWAEAMLRQGNIKTRKDHELAIYLFDTSEKRSSQMQVARNLYAKWPNDPDVLARIERLNVKAKIDGVPTVAVAGS